MASNARASGQPNVILFMTDQQRYDSIRALGAAQMITPTLDRMAREGTVFTHSFCASPTCVPSRASLFTGFYPHSTGVYYNASPWADTWIKHFRRTGYHTVNIGKMHLMPLDAPSDFDQRIIVENKDRPMRLNQPHGGVFDAWDQFLLNNGVRKPSWRSYQAEVLTFETALGAFPWPLDERYHPDIFVANSAKWFIERRETTAPLFLQIGFPGPHPPYDPPQRYADLYRDSDLPVPHTSDQELAGQPPPLAALRREFMAGNHDAIHWRPDATPEQLSRLRQFYAGNVTLIDELIGEILEALEARGYLENAIVVFLSDHGDNLGDHGLIEKWTMHDAVTHVPLIFWGPGRVAAGAQVDALTSLIDVGPSLFDLVGLPAEKGWQGESLIPLMRGEGQGRKFVFAEHPADNLLREVRYMTMVRSREHKLVHYLDQDWGELYDLGADPGETNNLWTDPACQVVRQRLLDEIRDWRIRCSLSSWEPYPYREVRR